MIKSIIKNEIEYLVKRCEKIIEIQSIMEYEEKHTALFYSLELEWNFRKLEVIIILALIGIKIDNESVKCDCGNPGA